MRKLFFIILIFLVACSKNYKTEIEPNNKKYNAMPIDIPVSIKGELSGSFDVDVFKTYLSIPGLYDVEIFTGREKKINAVIESDGKALKNVVFQSNIVLRNLFLQSGMLFFKINKIGKYNSSVRYKLGISKSKSDMSETEHEPNDSLVTANEINITNGYITGYYSAAVESDWFKFTVSESNKIISIEITGVPNIDAVVELYNSLGVLLKKVDSNNIDAPEVLKNFAVKSPAVFYLKVYAKNKKINTDIPYQLFIKLSNYEKDFEIEPNDIINNANTISNRIKGYLNPAGDTDVFFLHINNPVLLNVSITPVNNIDSDIKIYNGLYALLYDINYFSINLPEIYPDLYLAAGDYYISVSDVSNRQNYQDFYTLNLSLNKDVENWEREKNNDFSTATEVELNKKYNGFLAPIGDKDVYKFRVPKQETLKFIVSKVPSINFVLSVYGADYSLINDIDTKVSGEGETGQIELPAGTYYVIIKSADNKYNFNINYMMMILER